MPNILSFDGTSPCDRAASWRNACATGRRRARPGLSRSRGTDVLVYLEETSLRAPVACPSRSAGGGRRPAALTGKE
jgi:hypothetical protein